MQFRILILAVSFFAVAIAMAQDADQSQGSQILSGYKQRLQQALAAGMEQGAVKAIEACQIQAPEIAASLSEDGIRVGRASHRLRNPDNVAPDWVEPILETYLHDPADRESRTVSLGEDRSGYVEPIVLQPLCLVCHGEALADDVAMRIDELYPQDRAVDFRVGDLRGVFWVEYPD